MNTTTQYDILAHTPPATRPEWMRIDAAVKLFGLSRSTIYKLISQRRIKTFCLRDRNRRKGIRLLNYDSLCHLFESEANEAQEQELRPGKRGRKAA